MLLSAVNFALAVSLRAQFTAAEQATINKIKPAIGFVRQGARQVGVVAFISRDGYAITHQLSLPAGSTEIVTDSGEKLPFEFVYKDTPSQLCLVKTRTAPKNVGIVSYAEAPDGGKGMVLAYLPSGPVRGEITSVERIGVDERTRRSVPMNEVRVEQPTVAIGGALLFSGRGRLIGAIAATLAVSISQNKENAINSRQNDLSQNQNQIPRGFPLQANPGGPPTIANLGPQGMVIGYSPTWEVTRRALSGFLTPEHKAPVALLGVLVVPAVGGVQVQEVEKDSPAAKAGIKVGDVIVEIDTKVIRDHIDFARCTYDFKPEQKVEVVIVRGSQKLTLEATLGINPVASA